MDDTCKITGKLLTFENGFVVLEVSREDWLAREAAPQFAYALHEFDKKIVPDGVQKHKVITTERGYLIDGSEGVVLKAVLSVKEEPYEK